MRNELEATSDTLKFMTILKRVLNLTLDLHSSIVRFSEPASILDYLPLSEKRGFLEQVDTTRKNEGLKYMHCIDKYPRYNYTRVPIKYINGDYYTFFTIKTDSFSIPIGSKLTHINKIDVHSFVKDNIDLLVGVSYDLKYKKFCAERLILLSNTMKLNSLQFCDTANEKYDLSLENNKQFTVPENPFLTINLVKVKYFKKIKTLYIRLFAMKSSEDHIKLIRKYAKRKQIDNIIIDIRSNYGGNDEVWREIFEEIITYPFVQERTIAIQASNLSKKIFQISDTTNTKLFLGEKYQVLNSESGGSFIPSTTSISFVPKVLLIFDEYIFSSAVSCATVATDSEKFLTVGVPLRKPIGVGPTPSYIMLPKTGIIIRIDLSIDITNVFSIEDLFLKPNFEVKYTLEDYTRWYSKFGNRWKYNFLSNHDPFFKRALDIICK